MLTVRTTRERAGEREKERPNVLPWNTVQTNTNGLYLRKQRTMICMSERK